VADKQHITGVSDDVYNLVSIAYHALQGSENYDRYASDAERSGDQELVDFFREMQQEDAQISQRILALLRARITDSG
jgi:rubrerythrin